MDKKSEAQNPKCHSWDVGWSQFLSGSSALWTSLYSQPWTVARVSALLSHCCLEMPHWEQQCRGESLGLSYPGIRLLPITLSSIPEVSHPWNSNDFTSPASGCSRSWRHLQRAHPGRVAILVLWEGSEILTSVWDCFEVTPAVQSLLLVICLWELQMMTGRGLDSFVLILCCHSQRSIFCRDTCGPAERTALFWALWRWCPLDPLSPHRTYKCRGRGSYSGIVFASHCTSGFLDGSS